MLPDWLLVGFKISLSPQNPTFTHFWNPDQEQWPENSETTSNFKFEKFSSLALRRPASEPPDLLASWVTVSPFHSLTLSYIYSSDISDTAHQRLGPEAKTTDPLLSNGLWPGGGGRQLTDPLPDRPGWMICLSSEGTISALFGTGSESFEAYKEFDVYSIGSGSQGRFLKGSVS